MYATLPQIEQYSTVALKVEHLHHSIFLTQKQMFNPHACEEKVE